MTHIMNMKEISPFMHNALYRYSQFNTFEEFEQSGMLKHCLHLCRFKSPTNVCDSSGKVTLPCAFSMRKGVTNDLSEEILKKSVSEIIQDVEPVSIVIGTEEPIKSGPITVPIVSVPVPLKEPPIRPSNTRFNSRKPDTLFWSIFIAHYGVREFTEIGSKYMNREMEEKMRVMEFIKKNRPRMKSMKITAATGEEMMGDLLTNQSTSMMVLPALALFYETHIWIVSEETNTYLEYVPGTDTTDDTNYMIIYRATHNGRVSYTTETNEEPRNLIEKIQQTMIRIESIERPFKGISTYKLVDLEEIARKIKVQIPAGEKWKKNDWYVAITRYAQLGWLEPTRGRKPKDH